ncbi:MAG: MotA/TolQ/ExbB proton channel family protein [Chthoniobacter sp.]|nr:MotA/TolQ/ExbB proton channel family protein [Chthoniobacter sp.]
MKFKHVYLLALLTAALFLIVTSLQAQAPATPAKKGDEPPPPPPKTLWQEIKNGGWVMFPIALCSIGTLYLIGDGWIRTTAKRMMPEAHVEAVRSSFRQGDYVGAYDYCRANPSAFTNVCAVGVSLLGEGKEAVEEGMLGELAKENSKINTWISYLSVMGVCTPMIGLLGTVTGMIKAFATLGSSGIGDPSKLSEAIGEVLVATASGLFIAIPAFFGYYVLRNRSIKAIHDIQDTMASLLRKMPYDQLVGANIGTDELYAGTPNWLGHEQQSPTGTAGQY